MVKTKLLFVVVSVGILWLHFRYGVKSFNVEIKNQLARCDDLPIAVHRPYRCALDARAESRKLETWLSQHQHKFNMTGLYGFHRHCSRFSTGKVEDFQALSGLLNSESQLWNKINSVSGPNYSLENLTPYGTIESISNGERFYRHFGTKFNGVNLSNANNSKLRCSGIKRSCDTGKLFIKSAFPGSYRKTEDVPIETVINLKFKEEEKQPFVNNNVSTALLNHIKDVSNQRMRENGILSDKDYLKWSDMENIVNVLTLEHESGSAIEYAVEVFGIDVLRKINIFKEIIRYYTSSMPCIKCVEITKRLLKTIIKDLEWILEGSDGDYPRVAFDFSHDDNLITLLDYIGLFAGENDIASRNIPMCTNFQILVMKELKTGQPRALLLLNEEIKNFSVDIDISEPSSDSTYAMDSLIHFLMKKIA